MAFDPFSWFIGFLFTRAGLTVWKHLFPESLINELNKTISKWSSELPDEIYTPPQSILDRDLIETDEPVSIEFEKLVTTIKEGKIPNYQTWFDAIKFMWTKKKANLGDVANNFFKLNASIADSHLLELSRELEKTCIENAKLFQVTTFHIFTDLKSDIQRLESLLTTNVDLKDFSIENALKPTDTIITSFYKCKNKSESALGIAINNTGLILSIGYKENFTQIESFSTNEIFEIQEYLWNGPFLHILKINSKTNGIVPAYMANFKIPDFDSQYYTFDKFGNKVELSLSGIYWSNVIVDNYIFEDLSSVKIVDSNKAKSHLAAPILNDSNELLGLSFASSTVSDGQGDEWTELYILNWLDITKSVEIAYSKKK